MHIIYTHFLFDFCHLRLFSLFYCTIDVARSRTSDRCELGRLISSPHFHLSEGGVWQHMSGQRFVFLNGSIMAVHMRSYNDHDLKRHLII